jgi:hypothetical protein
MYGIGALVGLHMLTKGSDRMLKKVWVDHKPDRWSLPIDAGLACALGTFLGSMLEGEKKESVPEPIAMIRSPH